MRAFLSALCVFVIGAAAQAQVPHPSLEAYGELARVRSMAISPDGTTVAFVSRVGGRDVITTLDVATNTVEPRMVIDEIATRDLWFADNDHVVFIASDATHMMGFRGDFEYSAAFSVNIRKNELATMLKDTKDLFPAQSGLGNIVGKYKKPGDVLMPAYMTVNKSHSTLPRMDLLKVSLESGRGKTFRRGTSHTIDWFVDEAGTVLAREDYDNKGDAYRIYSEASGKMKKIYETEASRIPFSLIGVKADRSALILVDTSADNNGFDAVYEMDFEGNISAQVLERTGVDIDAIYSDHNRFVEGVKYSGALPSYHFYDPEVDAAVQSMVETFGNSAVHIVSNSDGWKQIVYLVYSSDTPGKYILQDRATGKVTGLVMRRDDIPAEAIGEIVGVSYPARDGLTIPAVLTWPAGLPTEDRKNLPLVVMPHGGPAAYDAIGFDWMAQYFANRGYVVLQPNFRGSSGYGSDFLRAGDGEWGRKMQDDVTDGVSILTEGGFVDSERICIVGASYGGYSALAGGAYTPELYKCVVAVAPVSDLPRMIRDVSKRRGYRHWAVDYWKEIIGDPKSPKVDLDAISPVNSAATFEAPVLLIHGKDDTVVPISQSEVMEKALLKEGKSVEFVALNGEDHWLSDGDTRIETLRAMSDFVEAHIGAR
jgi:dipeptidyl aminopeptidase/acylaminoacyl peptidase